jgi:hypothetical protein
MPTKEATISFAVGRHVVAGHSAGDRRHRPAGPELRPKPPSAPTRATRVADSGQVAFRPARARPTRGRGRTLPEWHPFGEPPKPRPRSGGALSRIWRDNWNESFRRAFRQHDELRFQHVAEASCRRLQSARRGVRSICGKHAQARRAQGPPESGQDVYVLGRWGRTAGGPTGRRPTRRRGSEVFAASVITAGSGSFKARQSVERRFCRRAPIPHTAHLPRCHALPVASSGRGRGVHLPPMSASTFARPVSSTSVLWPPRCCG